jgi:hypothetical protein
MNQNEIVKMWKKFELNSYYGSIPPSNEFIYFKQEIADEITQTGMKLTQEIKDKIDNYYKNNDIK